MKQIFTFLLTVMLCLSGVSASLAGDEELKFDLNKATVEQLMAIPDANISESLAKAIIEQSKKQAFAIPEDLLTVPGLDNKVLEAVNPVEEEGSLWYDPENAEMLLAPSKC